MSEFISVDENEVILYCKLKKALDNFYKICFGSVPVKKPAKASHLTRQKLEVWGDPHLLTRQN